MKIILIGGGKLAYFLSKQFASKGYQITIINPDRSAATQLSRSLKATVICAEPTNLKTLEEAGAYQAEVVLSLTEQDEDNLIACQIAKKKFGIPRTIALVNDPDNKKIFEKSGITVAFSATQIISNLIEQQTGSEDIKTLIPVAEGKVNLTEITLQEKAPAVGKTLQELKLPKGTLIACILRKEEVIVPRGETILKAGDRLISIGQPEKYGQMLRSLSGD